MTEVLVEVPPRCETCGYTGGVEPIHQKSKSSFGAVARVVGYYCPSCDTTHLYSLDPSIPESEPITLTLGEKLELPSNDAGTSEPGPG